MRIDLMYNTVKRRSGYHVLNNLGCRFAKTINYSLNLVRFTNGGRSRPVDGSKPVSGEGWKIPTTGRLFCCHCSVSTELLFKGKKQ